MEVGNTHVISAWIPVFSVFSIMRNFKCVSALLLETNEELFISLHRAIWEFQFCGLLQTDLLSQSNQYWFVQKVEKCYVSEEVIFLWFIKVIQHAYFNSDDLDLISEFLTCCSLFPPPLHVLSDFCRNASYIVRMSLVF